MEFDQISDPTGILAQTNYLNTPTNITTLTAPSSSGGYQFTEWTVNGVRISAAIGNSQNPAGFTLLEPTLAIAHYLSATQDTEGAGVPDWFKIVYFGNTNQSASSIPAGDGYTLLQKYQYGLNPLVWTPLPTVEVVAGGLSTKRSSLVALNLGLSPTYQLVSSPLGFIGTTNTVTNGTAITTPNLWNQSVSGYRFTYWDLDGVRQQDGLGMALGSFSFTVISNTVATANYMPATQDTEGAGVPDWFKIVYFGNTNQSATSIPAGDGYTLLQKYQYGLNPLVWTPLPTVEVVPGGISTARSSLVSVNLQGFPIYTLQSSPGGLIATSSNTVNQGTVITTPNLWNQSVSGYRFTYWDLDGVRQQDGLGMALGSFSFTVISNTVATANYMPATQDTEGAGVPDWFKIVYFGNTNQSATSIPVGDGYTLLQKYQYGLNLLVWTPLPTVEVFLGGISTARSSSVIVNLQAFERLQYTLVNGVISNFFTGFGGIGGVNFGPNAAPALGNWDGDGDLDIFVASSPGTVRVFENIGSRFNMNLAERTANFAALSVTWSDIDSPALALGDWSGNGRADLVIGGSTSTIRLISSTGNFNTPQIPDLNLILDIGSSNCVPALADLNGDGRVDLTVLLADGTVNVYTNTGNPNVPFVAPPALANLLAQSVPQGCGLAVADINYDGRPDVLVSDAAGRVWEFYQSFMPGIFTLMSKVWGGTGAGFASRLTLAAGDLNGDGSVDVLGGFAEGGLLALRDPRYGTPGNLQASGGVASIFLQWDPDGESRIAGYHVYRSVSDTNNFRRLNVDRAVVPRYEDTQPAAGATNFYRVTAVRGIIYPGNSVPQYVESRPSETVGATVGGVTLLLADYQGKPGEEAVLEVSTPLASGLSSTNLEIQIRYNPALLTPLGQEGLGNITVQKTALTKELTIADNTLIAQGELILKATDGGVIAGKGSLFDIHFRVNSGAIFGLRDTNSISFVNLQDVSGNAVLVNARDMAVFAVSGSYVRGDIDGDGVVTDKDVLLALQLAVGLRAATSAEISAGDLNGNGVIDKDDAQLIQLLSQGKSENPE